MIEFGLYLEPVDSSKIDFTPSAEGSRMGDGIKCYDDGENISVEEYEIAIVGVPEDRNAIDNNGCALAPAEVRKYFYRLFRNGNAIRIIDLGDIRPGNKVNDTYFALKEVLTGLLKAHVVPVVIGGSHDLMYAVYQAYAAMERIINMVNIDARFDLAKSDEQLHSGSYLSRIVLHKPNFLFNFANLGYQSYFVDPGAIHLMDKLFFDIHRLGVVRDNPEDAEPVLRNADTVGFDIGAVRQSDAPGNENASPNGFYGEEACLLMRYAGLSEKVSSLGLFEINPKYDRNGQTAQLAAQMLWYFLDGFASRRSDFPGSNNDQFIKYHVSIKGYSDDVVFYKSKITDRWWIEIRVNDDEKQNKYERHLMVPCSYSDYQAACNNEIPDCWWKTYQKLM